MARWLPTALALAIVAAVWFCVYPKDAQGQPYCAPGGCGTLCPGNCTAAALAEYDFFVNLNTNERTSPAGGTVFEANTCLLVQGAFNSWLDNTNTQRVWNVAITGFGTYDFGDLFDVGPYRVCVMLAPTNAIVSGYPDFDAVCAGEACDLDNNRVMNVHFLNAEMEYDSTAVAQTEPAVGWQRGNGYIAGEDAGDVTKGVINRAWTSYGRFKSHHDDTDEADANHGAVMNMTATTLVNTTNTFIHIFDSNWRRNVDHAFLHLHGPDDNDNIGILAQRAFGSNLMGGLRINGMGVGILNMGNMRRTHYGAYISGNDYNVQVADPVNGSDVVYLNPGCTSGGVGGTCAADPAIAGFDVMGAVIEGSEFGILTCYEDCRISWIGVHSEGTPEAPPICLGCGRCTTGDLETVAHVCADDTDCDGTDTCSFPAAQGWEYANFISSDTNGDGARDVGVLHPHITIDPIVIGAEVDKTDVAGNTFATFVGNQFGRHNHPAGPDECITYRAAVGSRPRISIIGSSTSGERCHYEGSHVGSTAPLATGVTEIKGGDTTAAFDTGDEVCDYWGYDCVGTHDVGSAVDVACGVVHTDEFYARCTGS